MDLVGGFGSIVSRRLIRRVDGGPRWARIALGGGLGLAVIGGLAIALGQRQVALVGGVWLASVAALLGALVTRLRPMLVVAVFGLALGVASLFVVLGVASGIERALIDSLARLNGHAMVSKYGLDFYEYEAVAAELEADGRVTLAQPFVFGVGALVVVEGDPGAGGREQGRAGDEASAHGPLIVSIKGVDPERLARSAGAADLLRAGNFEALRPADPRTAPGVVLGHRLARRAGAELGDRVRIVVPAAIRGDEARAGGPEPKPHHGEFEVLGLLDTGFAEFDASFVLVHLTAAQALVYGQARASGVEIELVDPALGAVMTTAEALVEQLNAPRVAAGKLPLYRAASWAQRSATLTSIRQTKAALVLILSLIVVVSSGSLIGALLLLLRGERRNIAMLAALGAKPRQLFVLFERIGVGVGVLGSALGLGLGALSLAGLALARPRLDPSIYMVDHLPVAFVVWDLLIPAAIAVLVCALATGPVAAKVARIKPIALLG